MERISSCCITPWDCFISWEIAPCVTSLCLFSCHPLSYIQEDISHFSSPLPQKGLTERERESGRFQFKWSMWWWLITRQLNGRDTWNSSKRWRRKGPERSMKQIEGLDMASENGVVLKKRVIVLVDQSTHAKDAMMWALTHVANKGDHLTLLEIIAPHKAQRKRDNTSGSSYSSSTDLANSLIAVCRAFKPEVCSPNWDPDGKIQPRWKKMEFWVTIFLFFVWVFFFHFPFCDPFPSDQRIPMYVPKIVSFFLPFFLFLYFLYLVSM